MFVFDMQSNGFPYAAPRSKSRLATAKLTYTCYRDLLRPVEIRIIFFGAGNLLRVHFGVAGFIVMRAGGAFAEDFDIAP